MSTPPKKAPPKEQKPKAKKRGRPKNPDGTKQEATARINALTRHLPADIRKEARALCKLKMAPVEILDLSYALLQRRKSEYLEAYEAEVCRARRQREWADRLRAHAYGLVEESDDLLNPLAMNALAKAKIVDTPLPDIRAHQRTLSGFAEAERKIADSLAPYRGQGQYGKLVFELEGVTLVQDPTAPTSNHLTTPLDAQIIAGAEGREL